MKWRNRSKCYYLFQNKAERWYGSHDDVPVPQRETNRLIMSFKPNVAGQLKNSVCPRRTWSKLFFNTPPTPPPAPHPHYRPCSLRSMKEWGFGLPRMMDGFHGEYEVRCEMPLARSSIFYLFIFFVYSEAKWRWRERHLKPPRLHVSLRLRLGCVVSQMPGTNPLALPYLRYCRRHLSQCHSGGMWGRWMAEEVAIAGEDKKKERITWRRAGKKSNSLESD